MELIVIVTHKVKFIKQAQKNQKEFICEKANIRLAKSQEISSFSQWNNIYVEKQV